ncbi:MAG: metallophosphoesterase [Bacillota bacterium]
MKSKQHQKQGLFLNTRYSATQRYAGPSPLAGEHGAFKNVDRINREDPALVIYLGDGPDRGGPVSDMRTYRETLEELKPPWHPAVGNHEIIGGAGRAETKATVKRILEL